MDIRINRQERVNLNVNGPIPTDIKVERYQKPLEYQKRSGWYCDKIIKQLDIRNQEVDSQKAAQIESERLQQLEEAKLIKIQQNELKLKGRLREGAKKKTLAFQTIIQQFHKESIEHHAPHKVKHADPVRLPKALSMEDLDIEQLPYNRTYQVYPNESFHAFEKYFESKPEKPLDYSKETEKDIRTRYRMGHLDEIKKKQFEKVYTETRKYYMDLERFSFLEKQKQLNQKYIEM